MGLLSHKNMCDFVRKESRKGGDTEESKAVGGGAAIDMQHAVHNANGGFIGMC